MMQSRSNKKSDELYLQAKKKLKEIETKNDVKNCNYIEKNKKVIEVTFRFVNNEIE